MLEIGGIEIPELVFSGWGIPKEIKVYYYEDPETKNKRSSGFSVTYPKRELTEEWMKELKEFRMDSVSLLDKNNPIGTLETLYLGLSNSSVEEDEEENTITFGFISDVSMTFLKPIFQNENN